MKMTKSVTDTGPLACGVIIEHELAVQGGIKTTDVGINWSLVNSGTAIDLSSVFFLNPDTGLIVGLGTLV